MLSVYIGAVIGFYMMLCLATIFKLWDCGIEASTAKVIAFNLPRIIKNVNIDLFIKQKNKNLREALFYLTFPLKYKSYLEFLAETTIKAEVTVEVILERKDALSRKEIVEMNSWIKSQGFTFQVNKNKEIVLNSQHTIGKKEKCIVDVNVVDLINSFDLKIA